MSPLQIAALAIDKLNSCDKWVSLLLQNAAVPSCSFTFKQRLNDGQFELLKNEILRQIQGVVNAHETLGYIYLGGDVVQKTALLKKLI